MIETLQTVAIDPEGLSPIGHPIKVEVGSQILTTPEKLKRTLCTILYVRNNLTFLNVYCFLDQKQVRRAKNNNSFNNKKQSGSKLSHQGSSSTKMQKKLRQQLRAVHSSDN